MFKIDRNLKLKFIGFSFVGLIITLFSILLLFFFIQLLNINLYVGYCIAYILSIFLSLMLNNTYVFVNGKITVNKIILYFLIYLSSMLIGLIFLWPFTYFFSDINKFMSSLLSIPITFLWNFFFVNKLLCEKHCRVKERQ